MIRRALMVVLVLAAAAAPACRAAERIVSRDFPGGPGSTVSIDTNHGDIKVAQSGDGRIHVGVRLRMGTDDAALSKKLFDAVRIEFKAGADAVSLLVRNPTETRYRFDWDQSDRLVIDFELLVPAGAAINLKDGGGTISSGNLANRIDARAKEGSVILRRIDGDVRAATDMGEIILSHCGGSATLSAVHGDVRVGTVTGRAEIKSVNGDVQVLHALGGLLLSTEVGDVDVGFSEDFAKEARITTDGGTVTARVFPSARCTVEASSVWGHVETKLPFRVTSGGDGKKTLTGSLNGGGALLWIHANGGHVLLKAAL